MLPRQIKLASDPAFMKKIFKKNAKKYFSSAKKLTFLSVKLEKNSFNQNFLFSYALSLNKNSQVFIKVIKGKSAVKINNPYDCPKRFYLTAKHLWAHGFKGLIPRPLDYLPLAHLFLYEETSGESLENKIQRGERKPLVAFAPRIAKMLAKLHRTKLKINFVKNSSYEKKQNFHHLYLIKKFNQKNYKDFKHNLELVERIKKQKQHLFSPPKNFCLTHGDFHPGNVLIQGSKIKFLDFGSAGLAERLTDVGNFLMQTELMLRLKFYPPSQKMIQKIQKIFLKNYFGRKPTPEENFKILYFELRCLFQVMANISLAQCRKPKIQKKSMASFFEILKKRCVQFQKLGETL